MNTGEFFLQLAAYVAVFGIGWGVCARRNDAATTRRTPIAFKAGAYVGLILAWTAYSIRGLLT